MYAWNRADQDDLYQEIVFQIWRALPGLKIEAHAGTWLYRVALNTAISFTRKHAARNGRTLAIEQTELERVMETRPAAEADPAGRVARLYEAIAQLNSVEKALVTLFLEELSYEEIATVMGLTPGNVGVSLHRAKKKLAIILGKEAP